MLEICDIADTMHRSHDVVKPGFRVRATLDPIMNRMLELLTEVQ